MLLSTTDFEEADRLVHSLNELNDVRKGSVGVIVKEIKKKIEDRDLITSPIIVLGNPNWRPALLGLVATSLVKEYGKPVFLWGRGDISETEKENSGDILKGSCRSDGITDMLEIMRNTSPDYFLHYGGHTMSGGFAVSAANIHKIEEELNKAYFKIIVKNEKEKKKEDFNLQVDRVMTIDDVNWITWKIIEKMAPFGIGNPKPLFLFENAQVENVKKFGKTKDHLEFVFKNSLDKSISAISFFATDGFQYKKNEKVSFIGTLEKSMYRNYPELRLRVVEITACKKVIHIPSSQIHHLLQKKKKKIENQSEDIEEKFEIFYKDGYLDIPKSMFEEKVVEYYPKYSADVTNSQHVIEYYILRDIGEDMIKWLKIKNLEALHSEPIWKQIVQTVHAKIEDLQSVQLNSNV